MRVCVWGPMCGRLGPGAAGRRRGTGGFLGEGMVGLDLEGWVGVWPVDPEGGDRRL